MPDKLFNRKEAIVGGESQNITPMSREEYFAMGKDDLIPMTRKELLVKKNKQSSGSSSEVFILHIGAHNETSTSCVFGKSGDDSAPKWHVVGATVSLQIMFNKSEGCFYVPLYSSTNNAVMSIRSNEYCQCSFSSKWVLKVIPNNGTNHASVWINILEPNQQQY